MNLGYTLHQAERAKTLVERRAENERLGELAAAFTRRRAGHAGNRERGKRGKPSRRSTSTAAPVAPSDR
jgi:hypothetical protein